MLDDDLVSCGLKVVSHSRRDSIDSKLMLPLKVHSCELQSSSILVANSIEVLSAYVALLTHRSPVFLFSPVLLFSATPFPQFAVIT